MRSLIILAVFTLFCAGCEKNSFDVNNPDVKEFVRQLKNGTYNQFEWAESGERLWAIMPAFRKEDLPALINLAVDTDLISPCGHFPVNPISSIHPYRVDNGKESMMIGEFLLWCAEAVIEGKDYASLVGVLVNENYGNDQRLSGMEVLAVRSIYQEWWDEFGHLENPGKLPLEGTDYHWR